MGEIFTPAKADSSEKATDLDSIAREGKLWAFAFAPHLLSGRRWIE
jgi:hypothetical protein